MSTPDDAELAARVRDAVRSDLPQDAPAFATTWAAAQARVRTAAPGNRALAARRPAFPRAFAAAAAVGVAALVLLVAMPSRDRGHEDADLRADLQLAVELRATVERSPFDGLLAAAPAGVVRGLPSLAKPRYPLLPDATGAMRPDVPASSEETLL